MDVKELSYSKFRKQLTTIETIDKLGNKFDIDPEYVERITGIPILGIKQTQPILPAGGEDGKKK